MTHELFLCFLIVCCSQWYVRKFLCELNNFAESRATDCPVKCSNMRSPKRIWLMSVLRRWFCFLLIHSLFCVATIVRGEFRLGILFGYAVLSIIYSSASILLRRRLLVLYLNCLPDVLYLLVFCVSFSGSHLLEYSV